MTERAIDRAEEPDHMWRLQDLELGPLGATVRYRCDLCLDVLVVNPGETHPLES